MQCRICLEEGDALTLLTPCQCRGTASYIHRACLDQYIRYYPDRICRVCRDRFQRYESSRELGLCCALLVYLFTILFFSGARLLVKIALLGAISVISFYYILYGLFSSTPLVFVSILTMLFLPHSHPSAVYMWMIILGGVAFVYTLARYLPVIILLGIIVVLFVTGYTAFLAVAAYHALDPPAFTVFLSVLYLFWYAGVHHHPRLRYV